MDVSKGMYWVGHPGSLYPLKDYVGQLDIEDDDQPIVQTPMGGGRLVRVRRNRAPRTWQVTIPGAHVDEVKHLRTLLTATLGPYVWVDPHAQVTNVLTPEQSVLKSTSPAIALAGGWPIAGSGGTDFATVARVNPAAAGGSQGVVRIGPAPVPPSWANRKVTVSAYLGTSRTAGAYLLLRWLSATGTEVRSPVLSEYGNFVTGMDGLRRSVATGTPPPGAATCQIDVFHAEVIAQPAVTWTDDVVEWDVGNGAQRVHIFGTKRSTEHAVPTDRSLRRHDLSFTVMEVGPTG